MQVQDLLSLKDKTALITGGSRGLGLQMAEALGEMGARIAITARKKDELGEAVSHLKKMGIEAEAFVCDIGKREQVAPLADAVEAWDKLVNVNLTGAFLLSQQIAKRSMIPNKWGRIINTASVAGLTASDPRVVKTVAYNATKHGLVGLTRQLAAEWGEHGITVNAICPGFFPSKMTRATLDTAGKAVLEVTPTRRLGNDEDLKGLAVLLASEASRHITGQAIAVDGGATIL